MPTTNRTIRLFVSSTFSDFKAERDLLQRDVFPKLHQLCLSKGLRFQAIDLRWGVPEEAGKDSRTMRICQRELKRCQKGPIKPNFLVLLGDRYGWRPLPEIIPADLLKELETRIAARDPKIAAHLKSWYRRDDNAVPPVHELRPREGRFGEFATWASEVERPMLAALEQVADELRADPSLSAELREALNKVPIGTSATEQEIFKGALDLEPDEVRHHVHAFSRTVTDAPIPPHHDFADFLPEGLPDDQARERLAKLKSKLNGHLGEDTNFHNYSVPWQAEGNFTDADLESFANLVFDCLRQVITAQVAALQGVSQEEQEEQAHRAFCEERRNGFHGRTGSLASIATYLRHGPAEPLAIIGPAGSGKSALMAQSIADCGLGLAERPSTDHPNVLFRFIGVTPGSSDLIELLRDLVGCIRRHYPKESGTGVPPVSDNPETGDRPEPPDSEIPFEINPLTIAFHQALDRATADRPLWLFLDALDQFRETNLAGSLSWLPQKLPSHVRIVVSTASRSVGVSPTSSSETSSSSISDQPSTPPSDPRSLIHRNLSRLCPGEQTIRLDPLTDADGAALLDHWLKAAYRTLHDFQRKLILAAFAVEGNALWLRVAAEEAARWPRWHTPEPPPPGLHELLVTVLERLSRNDEHGAVFVKRALGYLACARHGLTEDEIIGVLGADPTVMADIIARSPTERDKPEADQIKVLPVAIWVRFHGDIAFYLSERQNQGAALFGFYHRSFGEAVERFCLRTDADRQPLHETMSRWFGAQPWFLPPTGEHGQPPREPERSDPANARKASELPFHLQRVAELTPNEDVWNPLVDVLCDLDCLETKARSGLIYELVGDYNAALAALPEFCEENEYLAKRDAAMIAYNKALREYAVVRCEWWFAKERGETRPEPSYPPLPEELRSDAAGSIPEKSHPRAARLRHFFNFINARFGRLAATPRDVLPLAFNLAEDGPVSSDAEQRIASLKAPWLRNSPRPPTSPLRPQCLRSLEGHADGVLSVSASPDGRHAIWGSSDETLRIWDLDSGVCLRTIQLHEISPQSVSVSPDGRIAVTGSEDKTLRVWDLETGACQCILEGHAGEVLTVSVSPDGRRAVSGSEDKTLRVWDLETGQCLRTLEGHAGWVTSVSVSPDGRRAVLNEYKTLRVWDLETGGCLSILQGHTDWVEAVSVSPDGRRAVSAGGWDKTLRVWDLETGACLRTLEGHQNYVQSVSVTRDGRRAISGSWDKTLRVWDLDSDACLQTLPGHSDSVESVSVSPDGCLVVSGSNDKTLRVWNLDTGRCLQTLEGHDARIESVSISQDGLRALSGSCDHNLRVWDLETGSCLHILQGHSDSVGSVSVSPEERRAVSISDDKTLRIWDLNTGQCLRTLEGNTAKVSCMSVSLDWRRVVSGSWDKTLRIWDLETGACLHTLQGHTACVQSVSVSPDGRRAISGGWDKTLRVWDLESGACLRTLEGHQNYVQSVSVSPDGRLAVSGSDDNTLRIWDLETGTCLHALEGHANYVWSVSVSPDGWRTVSIGWDNTLRVWDLETGQCLAIYFAGSQVNSAAFSLDGGRIVCGTSDGQMHFLTPVNFPPSGPPIITAVRLWHFGDNGAPGRWDEHVTALCPHCGQRFPVRDDMLGQQIACPLDSCGKLLQLNPFVVDSGTRNDNT